MSGNSFYQFVASHYRLPVTFDAETKNGNLIRSILPIERFEKEIDAAINADSSLQSADRHQLLVIKLLAYFKNDFFRWVDALDCPACTTRCVLFSTQGADISELVFLATSVEVYRCPACGTLARFPRYNDPRKLLTTRQGRCGEWANCFAYILYCLNIGTRLVYCTSDHVWVEFYNRTEKRWIHADPCENAIDNPLIYEVGWGKKMDLVVARGEFELRDVTWRYTAEWRVTAQDRARMLSEKRLLEVFTQWNTALQARLSSEQKLAIQKRWVEEMVEFIRMPHQELITPGGNANVGRQSGSLAWRLSRAEIGSSAGSSCSTAGGNSSSGHTFKLPPQNQPGKVMITYDCSFDSYRVETLNTEGGTKSDVSVIQKWNAGVASFENIQRKTENDWAMAYLARREGSQSSDTGLITWNFKEEEGEQKRKWSSIDVHIKGQTYENGSVELTLTVGQLKRSFKLNEVLHISRDEVQLEGDSPLAFQIEARLGGGKGNVAYQHAQMFRQKWRSSALPDSTGEDRENTFTVTVEYS